MSAMIHEGAGETRLRNGSFREEVVKLADSPKLDLFWEERTKHHRRYLMICHDQTIDRRIIQQAATLQEHGWRGIVVAFSHTEADLLDVVDGVPVHRISTGRIVNDDPSYWGWKWRERLCRRLPGARFWGRLNFLAYKAFLGLRYRSRYLNHPLPFDLTFYGAARHYKADMIEAHDLPALKTAVLLSREWGAPAIYDAHEFYPEQKIFSRKQKKIMFEVEGEYIKACAAVLTVNRELAECMATRYNCPAPHEIFNAVDAPPDLDRGADLLRKHFSLNQNAPILLYQGGLAPRRNLDLLVKSMAHLKHPRAVLVLMGNGSYGEKLKALTQKAGCGRRIYFKEAVPQKDLLYWTSTADIGVIPYGAVDLNTTFCNPNKMFEFIQAELPILANNLPGLQRFVGDNGFGRLVTMDAPEAIAAGLDEMLAAPEELMAIRRRLAAGKSAFSWRKQAEKYMRLVAAATEGPDGRPGFA